MWQSIEVLRFSTIGLIGLAACGNSVIIEAGTGGASTTGSGSGGESGASVSSVGPSASSVGVTTVTTITSVASSSSTGGGIDCLNSPDCFGCFCNELPGGCQVYQAAVLNNIFCGLTCGQACADFCMNPTEPNAACIDCVDTQLTGADIDAFLDECGDSPACVQFLDSVQACNN